MLRQFSVEVRIIGPINDWNSACDDKQTTRLFNNDDLLQEIRKGERIEPRVSPRTLGGEVPKSQWTAGCAIGVSPIWKAKNQSKGKN